MVGGGGGGGGGGGSANSRLCAHSNKYSMSQTWINTGKQYPRKSL